MAAVNYAENYQKALIQKYAAGLRFWRLYDAPYNKEIKFVDAKTVKIPNVLVKGMTDYNRDVVGTYTRNVDNQWEVKTLEHDREFRTLVDPMDIDETNMALSIANVTRVFNDEEKIPEMDKYMASKLYEEFTTLGGVADTTAPTAANVLELFDTYMSEMDEAEVPQENRILYVTPAVDTLLKNADKISRAITVNGTNDGSIKRNVRSLDDVVIEVVSSARMKTLYDFTVGAVAGVGAQQINMLLIHPTAVLAPQKYEMVSLDEPSAATGGKYLYFERKYWDVFLLKNKVAGVKFNVAAI